ncbi:MAG: hypothetical protein R2685_10525 [Candidatus Nitrosocosmicus sp.]|nr:hypothetical protein [Candidatus Nitrosocosmicus sp.]
MTFKDDDEIKQIQQAKLKKAIQDTKKHKPNVNIVENAKPNFGGIPEQPKRPIPPVLVINSLIAEIMKQTYPIMKDGFDPKLFNPQTVPSQVILNAVLDQVKAGNQLTEEQIKNFGITVLDVMRELEKFEFIYWYEDNGEWVTCIREKGMIYWNMINYLAGPNLVEHYAIYLEIARGGL